MRCCHIPRLRGCACCPSSGSCSAVSGSGPGMVLSTPITSTVSPKARMEEEPGPQVVTRLWSGFLLSLGGKGARSPRPWSQGHTTGPVLMLARACA